MNLLYLIRHGQAGTRSDYDALSDLGRVQACRLGEYLVSQNIQFRAIYSGGLRRQRETAAEVRAVYHRSGIPMPEELVEPGWNEFDLDGVYAAMSRRLCAEDGEFRRKFEQIEFEAADPGAPVHRAWTACDMAIVQAWLDGRYPFEGETWIEFQQRVARCFDETCRSVFRPEHEGPVAVFTSALPIGISVATVLGLTDGHPLRFAGALANSAITVLGVQGGRQILNSFNGVPHLPEPAMRTFR